MGQYLQQAASPKVLNHAWRFFRNERGLWQRGLTVPDMQRDLIRHIGELSVQILSGVYRPESMRCFEINKADGGKRLITAATVRDRLVQRALLTVLEPLGEARFHRDSFGFRPQCTLDMALARVRERVRDGYVWLGDADIRACFDNIPYEKALKRLYHLCKDRQITAIVRAAIESMPDQHRPAGKGRGLPQGMVLSPFLCNLYLHDMDMDLADKGIPFVRFADDFILPAKDEERAAAYLKNAGRSLKKLGLELHPEKTRVIRSSPHYRFLGKRLPNGKPRFQV